MLELNFAQVSIVAFKGSTDFLTPAGKNLKMNTGSKQGECQSEAKPSYRYLIMASGCTSFVILSLGRLGLTFSLSFTSCGYLNQSVLGLWSVLAVEVKS